MSCVDERDVGKLFHLKSWVELSDAARYLSVLLGEGIGREDVLMLALEGHLTLSVRFLAGVTALCGTTVARADAKLHQLPTLDGEGFFMFLDGTAVPGTDRVIQFEDRIRTISDVWDLPMFGGERMTVENLYEEYLWREPPELFNLEGCFVRNTEGLYCKLMERFEKPQFDASKGPYDPSNYFPAAALPEDSVLVVRTAVLRELAERVAQPSQDTGAKALERRERATLLTMIAALAKLAKVDISKPSSAASAIESATELLGARVAARTIENHLKRVPEALESKATA